VGIPPWQREGRDGMRIAEYNVFLQSQTEETRFSFRVMGRRGTQEGDPNSCHKSWVQIVSVRLLGTKAEKDSKLKWRKVVFK